MGVGGEASAYMASGPPLPEPDGEVLVILLTGGTKKRQQRDIDTAHALWSDYKRRRPKP